MKTKLIETKFRSALGRAGQLLSKVVWLGAVILICSSASAQNLFVSGRDAGGGEIFKFTWDGKQSIFASGLYKPWDLAFDSAGNLFVVDYEIVGGDLPRQRRYLQNHSKRNAKHLCVQVELCFQPGG